MRDARLRFRELQQNSAESFSPGEGLKSSISLSRGEERTRNHFPAGKTDIPVVPNHFPSRKVRRFRNHFP